MTPEEWAKQIQRHPCWFDPNGGLLRATIELCRQVEIETRRVEREACAKVVEGAQIFHCWGDSDINGLDVQKRLAAAIRSRSDVNAAANAKKP